MATGEIEINEAEISRFLQPVLTDHNNNLVAYYSYTHLEKLTRILNMPGFDRYYQEEKKMFPIFFNFFGESQLTIALSANDTESFY